MSVSDSNRPADRLLSGSFQGCRGFTGKYLRLAAITAVILLVQGCAADLMTTVSPDVLFSVRTGDPLVALTIDDVPDPETTPGILEVLAEHDAKATFFMISSRIEGNEALVSQIVRRGHELGNHLTQDRPSIKLAPGEFEKDLLEADAVLTAFGPVRWARPGSGWYNETMLSIMERHGYRCVLGSIYPVDAQLKSPSFSSYRILGLIEPGSIIILHDGGDRGLRTAEVLRTILPEIGSRGLRLVTLSELVESGDSRLPREDGE